MTEGSDSILDDLLVPHDADEEVVFVEPWSARAFALTLALSERGVFTLQDFQNALIDRVACFEATDAITGRADYYTRWLEALETLLATRGLLPEGRVHELEHTIVQDAASRKAHQHVAARDVHGKLRIAPLFVDNFP